MVEDRHEIGSRLVLDAPQRGDGAPRPCCQKGAAEALDAFATDEPSALGLARAQHREIDTLQWQVVDLSQEQVIRPGRRLLAGRRKENTRLLEGLRIREGVRGKGTQ